MICDSLTHLTEDGKWFHTDYRADYERLDREIREASVELTVVVAIADFIENEFVYEQCQRNPNVLIPGASFNPSKHENAESAVRKLREEIDAEKYPVLKLHPRFNRYDLLDERCSACFEELSSWKKKPYIWLDTFLEYKGAQLKKPVVPTLTETVRSHPGLQFVLLHSAGEQVMELYQSIKDTENSYLDLSFSLSRFKSDQYAKNVQTLVDNFHERVLFGSDFPEYSIEEAHTNFHRLTKGLPEEKIQSVLSENLLKMFKKGGA